ncbi:MAG: glucosaminidase domain-containing protein [Mariprofundus sp.]
MTKGIYTLLSLTILLSACSHALPPVEEAEKPIEKKAVVVIAPKTVVVPVAVPAMKVEKKQKRHNKRSFITLMKPIIKQENAQILQNRLLLQQWKSQALLSSSERHALNRMAEAYKVSLQGDPDGQFWNHMLRRVDIVPLDMVLAQAANESAWGNSRFARQGNNYFGQWCYQAGCGLVPLRRNSGAHHEVKRFASPQLSVRAYLRNLNTSAAYKMLRKLRLLKRRNNEPLDAEFLALGLKGYSERGMAYVKSIRSLVRANRELIHAL